MANLCDFEMKIVGERENIELFTSAMRHTSDVFMGRGAELNVIDYYDADGYAQVAGFCKWSLASALTRNAIDMRENPERWSSTQKDKDGNFKIIGIDELDVSIVTLEEACKMFNVTIKAFSTESGNCFAEHCIVTPEGTKVNEICDYFEYYMDEYLDMDMTKEEAEKEIGIPISDEDWEDPNSIIIVGGFKAEYSI